MQHTSLNEKIEVTQQPEGNTKAAQQSAEDTEATNQSDEKIEVTQQPEGKTEAVQQSEEDTDDNTPA